MNKNSKKSSCSGHAMLDYALLIALLLFGTYAVMKATGTLYAGAISAETSEFKPTVSR